MKFKEPIIIQLNPNYSVFETERVTTGNETPRDPRFDSSIGEGDDRTYCGGKFDWGVMKYPENHQEDISMKVQLMRLWTTTMYTQLASDLSHTNEMDSVIKVGLTEEELDTLVKINNKITKGIFDEMDTLNNSLIRKKTIKKVDFKKKMGLAT